MAHTGDPTRVLKLAAGALIILALAACSPKAPSGRVAHAPASPVTQKTLPLSNADMAKSEAAYPVAKLAAANFMIANPQAPEAKVIAVATQAALHAGDPDAKDTGENAASDAKDWVATRKANGFPPRTTAAELAANDAVADAEEQKTNAEFAAAEHGKASSPSPVEPMEPSRGAHYFPKIGKCFNTQVASIGSRLENTPDSGDAVEYSDGHYQVSYETSPVVQKFHVGDPIRLCVIEVPGHCPPADDRGILFLALNLRTGGRWKAADSEHQCGGA